ncbi:hypothetical protein PF007_g29855, partial [Phytophthora fragariae]
NEEGDAEEASEANVAGDGGRRVQASAPPEPTPGPASLAAATAYDGNDAKEVADDEAPRKQKNTTGKGKKQTQTTGKSKKHKQTTGKGKRKAEPPGPAAEGPAAAVDASVDARALAVVEEVMADIVATVSGTAPVRVGFTTPPAVGIAMPAQASGGTSASASGGAPAPTSRRKRR